MVQFNLSTQYSISNKVVKTPVVMMMLDARAVLCCCSIPMSRHGTAVSIRLWCVSSSSSMLLLLPTHRPQSDFDRCSVQIPQCSYCRRDRHQASEESLSISCLLVRFDRGKEDKHLLALSILYSILTTQSLKAG